VASQKNKIRGLVFVVSGPSGSGKTTLLKKLLSDESLSKKAAKSISYTTRPQRSNEQDGRDYFFITQEEFKRAKKAKKILEWTRYLGYYYATPKDVVAKPLKKGKNIILCLDYRGVLAIHRVYPADTITIFIAPPSLNTLHQRIVKRCHKTKKEEVKKRLKLARREILDSSRYDYCLVNKNLGQAVKGLKGIIVKAINMRERGIL
jgi:guanylate kinase